jgi:hypothetical protein
MLIPRRPRAIPRATPSRIYGHSPRTHTIEEYPDIVIQGASPIPEASHRGFRATGANTPSNSSSNSSILGFGLLAIPFVGGMWAILILISA